MIATANRSDFSLGQCRNALADFDQDTVEQAVVVMTSGNDALIKAAASNPEMSRPVFWVREWLAVERIQSRSEALNRLKVVPSIRAGRKVSVRNMLFSANYLMFSLAVVGQTGIWFTA